MGLRDQRQWAISTSTTYDLYSRSRGGRCNDRKGAVRHERPSSIAGRVSAVEGGVRQGRKSKQGPGARARQGPRSCSRRRSCRLHALYAIRSTKDAGA